MSRILLLTAHEIAEYDDLRMLSRLGHDVFSIGAYSNPGNPGATLRPALPEVAYHPELERLCIVQREAHAGQSDAYPIVDWAKADLHPDLIDWAEVIICHHFLDSWVIAQWPRIRHKRVIWRTCGQSDPRLEQAMAPLRADGLQIVRYSPAERRAFEKLGVFAGQDAMIRFGKEPSEWLGWTGVDGKVINISAGLARRGEFTHADYWKAATRDLPALALGPGSEDLGGPGALSYDDMRTWLRRGRAYLYTGTQPASYTLGLIEAMMTGIPIVSIGPAWMWVPDLFEGHELTMGFDNPALARDELGVILVDDDYARMVSAAQRTKAIDYFGMEQVSAKWAAFLGCQAKEDAA